jgi:uncharacterized protein (DUF2147 family)
MVVIFKAAAAAVFLFAGLLNSYPEKAQSNGLEAAASVEAGHTEQTSEIVPDMTNISTLTADDESLAVTGLWLSADERGIIHIYEKDGRFYGRLVWLKEPEDDRGYPVMDEKNPDPDKRTWPILGLEMVMGLEYSGGEWRNGEIYDPESGNTYSARLRLNGSNRMDLRGYIRLPMFGRTESWTRIDNFPDDGKIWPGF